MQTDVLCGERRAARRYSLELELRYSMAGPDDVVQIGRGRTRNISSQGVLFEADTQLPVGVPVKLSIQWPVFQEGTQPMRLIAIGPTVRSEARGPVVAIQAKNHYLVSEAMDPLPEAETIAAWKEDLSGLRDRLAHPRPSRRYREG